MLLRQARIDLPDEIRLGVYHSVSRNQGNISSFSNLPDLTGRILEIGCSMGNVTRQLKMLYPHASILSIDINPELGDKRKQIEGVEFRVADGYDFKHDKKFQAVFAMNNLAYELNYAHSREYLQNIIRLIEERGYFFISRRNSGAIFQNIPPNFITSDDLDWLNPDELINLSLGLNLKHNKAIFS